LPALRDRRSDIRLLVDYFLRKIGAASGGMKSINENTLIALEAYSWPGNVRELENVLRRAVVVAKGPAILPGDLPAELHQSVPAKDVPKPVVSTAPVPMTAVAGTPPSSGANEAPATTEAPGDIPELARLLFRWAKTQPGLKVLPAVERELVIEALRETQGNQVRAARLLGITRATLRKRVDKFGIRRELNVT